MEDRKVHRLMRSLNKRELRRFRQWLAQELSPRQEAVLRLFQHIRKGDPAATIWPSLFPGVPEPDRPLLDPAFRRLENHLSEFLEEFIAIETFRRDQVTRDLYLIRGLNERQMPGLFDAELNKVRKRLDRQPARNASYHRAKFELLKEEKAHRIRHSETAAVSGPYYDQFHLYWLHERLKMALIRLGEAGFSRQALQAEEITHLLHELEEALAREDCPLLHIYRHILLMQRGEELSGDLQHLLTTCSHMAGFQEQKNLFLLLANHLVRQYNRSGDLDTGSRLFDLYVWGIQEKLVYFGGYLPAKTYRNIISIGLHIGEFDTVYSLIHDLIGSVPAQEQEETFRFNLGLYYFALGDTDKVFRLFTEKFHQTTYEVAARTKLLCLRYEQGERTELESPMRSLRLFVQSQKHLSQSFRDSSIRQIRLLEKLVRMPDNPSLDSLLDSVSRIDPDIDRVGLLSQIRDLSPRLNLTGV